MKIYKLVRHCTACRVLSHCVIASHIIHTVRKIIWKQFLRLCSSCIKFILLFFGEVRKEKMSDSPHKITVPVPAYIPVYVVLAYGNYFDSHFWSVFGGVFCFVTLYTPRWADAHSTVTPRKGTENKLDTVVWIAARLRAERSGGSIPDINRRVMSSIKRPHRLWGSLLGGKAAGAWCWPFTSV